MNARKLPVTPHNHISNSNKKQRNNTIDRKIIPITWIARSHTRWSAFYLLFLKTSAYSSIADYPHETSPAPFLCKINKTVDRTDALASKRKRKHDSKVRKITEKLR